MMKQAMVAGLREPDWIFLASLERSVLLRGPYPRPSNARSALRLFHCQAHGSELASPSNKKAGTTSL